MKSSKWLEMTDRIADLQNTASQAEQYINGHLFDVDGLMYSYVDVRTGRPFDETYVAHFKEEALQAKAWQANRRADSDPVTYWSYEDSVITAGHYMVALVLKYEVTGDAKALEQAFKIWERYRLCYYASQVYGEGSFLRPYGGFAGGFAGMSRWMEPLGTDQASPLLRGQYALWKHAQGEQKSELTDIMVKTLSWYERQNFKYLWYKSIVHSWNDSAHAGSYYFPAIVFAAKVTGDEKWRKLQQAKLPGASRDVTATFKFGGDLIMLADLLGPEEFERACPKAVLDGAYEAELKYLATFSLPGMRRAEGPGVRSVHTVQSLCGLAGIGYPGAAEKALEIMATVKRVPDDFTVFLADAPEKLPEAGFVQLQAYAVGVLLVVWYRNYWILRKALLAQKK